MEENTNFEIRVQMTAHHPCSLSSNVKQKQSLRHTQELKAFCYQLGNLIHCAWGGAGGGGQGWEMHLLLFPLGVREFFCMKE